MTDTADDILRRHDVMEARRNQARCAPSFGDLLEAAGSDCEGGQYTAYEAGRIVAHLAAVMGDLRATVAVIHTPDVDREALYALLDKLEETWL